MAQLGARLNGIQEVGGSIPPSSTKNTPRPCAAGDPAPESNLRRFS